MPRVTTRTTLSYMCLNKLVETPSRYITHTCGTRRCLPSSPPLIVSRDLPIQATLNVTETIQDIHTWSVVIRSKRTPNPGDLAKIGRRHEIDTLRESIRKEVVNQRPDDIVVDVSSLRIHVIEVPRTEDSTDQLRLVFVRKNTKYIQLMQQLRALFPDFRTERLTFVIGICGTIDEHLWCRQLTMLGLTAPKQDH